MYADMQPPTYKQIGKYINSKKENVDSALYLKKMTSNGCYIIEGEILVMLMLHGVF